MLMERVTRQPCVCQLWTTLPNDVYTQLHRMDNVNSESTNSTFEMKDTARDDFFDDTKYTLENKWDQGDEQTWCSIAS